MAGTMALSPVSCGQVWVGALGLQTVASPRPRGPTLYHHTDLPYLPTYTISSMPGEVCTVPTGSSSN